MIKVISAGSAFQSGRAAEAIEKIEDKELAQIAQGEYYFFSAQAEKCVETIKDYLDHDDVMLRLSADMLIHLRILHLEIHRQHSVQGKMYISVCPRQCRRMYL